MKKVIFFISLCLATLTANAQLKVGSNGYVGMTTTSTPLSPVSLNYGGDSNYYMAYKGHKKAMYSEVLGGGDIVQELNLTPSGSSTAFVGLRSRVKQPDILGNNTISSFGVQGIAQKANYNYGVTGNIVSQNNGAAVLGVVGHYFQSFYVTGRYAGYFFGDVKSTGTMTANQFLTPSSSSGTTSTLAETNQEVVPVTANLGRLKGVVFYNNPANSGDRTNQTDTIDVLGNKLSDDEVELSSMEQQQLSKVHHGLDVEKLSEVFPELVYELEDGSKAINYIEMIPLLVQSINELQSQINTLTGKEPIKKTPSTTAVSNTSFTAQAMLYQNTPNPFNERTTIRFTLPEDAQNASICIFDMSGKMLKQIPVNSGMQSIVINGYELAAGMYLYSLVIKGQEIDTKRMILFK